MRKTFEELVAEANEVSVDGWDFSWLDGRALEKRPPWGYQGAMAAKMAGATASLDLQTGGGEVLAGAGVVPTLAVATEAWPPNLPVAAGRLHPLGIAVVSDNDEPPLPFADDAFDLVTSRHPVKAWWSEIHRVLAPGGTYLSQQVGPASVFELVEFFLGPQPESVRRGRHWDDAAADATAAGLEVLSLQTASLRTEFYDIGAVIYFLRKVIWMVPGFTVAEHHAKLRELHAIIERDGKFSATTTRFLIEARKPQS